MSFLLNPYVFSLQNLTDFQATMVIGEDSYTDDNIYLGDDGEGNPLFGLQNYYAYGFNADSESFQPGGITFGSLTPSSYGATSFNYFYYDATSGSLGNNAQLKMGRSGPDTTAGYPTINDYPLTPSPITTTVNVISLPLNIAGNLFESKYYPPAGTSVTLRFARRTDILTAGSSTVTVPTGATRAIIVAIGGGGGGARVSTGSTRRGGGGGATSISDVSVSSSDWGTNVSYTVGAGGVGRVSTNGSGTAGGASTFIGLSLVMTAGGGGGATTTAFGTAGAASGGNLVNDNGVVGSSATTWTTPRDTAYGFTGSGGWGGVNANGLDGLDGAITIVWY